jgi:6-phosphogluconolactonase
MPLLSHEFTDKAQLNEGFGRKIVEILELAISDHGKASIAVSGGSTPKPLFAFLSTQSLAWDKVNITLVDDRWLDDSHKDSNEKLVKENLLVNKASAANFVSLKTSDDNAIDAETTISERIDAVADGFDVLILGMGEDGHTASLFPCSEQIKEGLNLERAFSAIATQPTTAPYQRMSMSLAKIIKAKNVFLHLTGDTKKQVLNQAIANHTSLEKPIKAVCENTTVNLMWAP